MCIENISVVLTEQLRSALFYLEQLAARLIDCLSQPAYFSFSVTYLDAGGICVFGPFVNPQYTANYKSLRDTQAVPTSFFSSGSYFGYHDYYSSPKPFSNKPDNAANASASSCPSAMARNSVPPLAASMRTFKIDF